MAPVIDRQLSKYTSDQEADPYWTKKNSGARTRPSFVKTPHAVPTTAREMFHEPPAEVPYFLVLQQSQYWRYVADAYKDMVPEGFRELLHSLGPPPPLQQRQGHPPQPTVYQGSCHHLQLPRTPNSPRSTARPTAPSGSGHSTGAASPGSPRTAAARRRPVYSPSGWTPSTAG